MCSSTPSFLKFLVLNRTGSSSTSPSRLPRMLVEYHPLRPSRRALNAGARTVFIRVCPVLKSLPQTGASFLRESSSITGRSTVRSGAPLVKGTPSIKGRVDHGGRDHFVVTAQRLLEGLHELMRFGGLDVRFGGTAPGGWRRWLSRGYRWFGKIHLCLALLHIGAVDFLDVVMIEDGGARLVSTIGTA